MARIPLQSAGLGPGQQKAHLMIVRSPYPDVEVPKISLPGFVLKHGDQRGAVLAVIDAPTGRTLVRVGDGLAWTT